MTQQQDRKVALITGATRGIGLETARQLAAEGVHVIVGAREAGKGDEVARTLQAEGASAEAVAIDVTDASSIAQAVRSIEQRHGKLDILVNNAGILRDDFTKKPSEQTLEAWRATFDTNLFGLVAVTQAFLPLLHKAPAARIVNVSSILGSLALHADPASPIYNFKVPAYNVSKSAVNAWTVQLAYELRNGPIKVNAIHPGYVRTDMNNGEGELDIAEGARTSVRLALIDADGPNGGYFHFDESLPW
jgi:NAD(P)-dependent dehydrogenase (short-subunit alcohol dehydrogenase family)